MGFCMVFWFCIRFQISYCIQLPQENYDKDSLQRNKFKVPPNCVKPEMVYSRMCLKPYMDESFVLCSESNYLCLLRVEEHCFLTNLQVVSFIVWSSKRLQFQSDYQTLRNTVTEFMQ